MFKTYYEKVSDDYESHTSEDEEQGFDSSPKENSLPSSSLNTTIISSTENNTEQKAVCSKACCSSSKACKEEEELQPNNSSSTTSSTMFVNHIKHTKGVKPKVMFGKKKIKISQLQHLNKHVNSEEEACSDDCEKPSYSNTITSSCKSNCCSSGSCTKEEPIIKTDCCSSGSCSKKAVVATTPVTLVSEKKSCCTSGCCQSTSTAEIKVEELMKLDNLLPNQKSLHLNVRNLHCADCASMVEGVLTKKKGIISARVLHMTDTAQVVYDELVLQEAFIVKTIQELGFPTSVSLLKNVSLSNSDQETLTTMFEFKQELQTHKIDELVQSVQKGEGILHAAFDNANQILQVVYNPDITGARDIKKMIESIDASHMFSIMSSGKANEITDTNNKNEIKVWRRNLIVSFILSIPVIFTAFIFPMIKPVDEFLKKEFLQGLNSYIIIGLIFSTPIQFYFGKPLYLSAYRALRYAKKPNMDTLVMLSTTTAYVYSLVSTVIAMCVESYKAEAFFETSALLLTFIILGRFLEILAKGQTSSILTSILKLRCTKAFLMFRGNYERITCQTDLVNNSTFVEEEEIDTELVQRGDILKCLPGSKIPTDGVVFYGTTSIDESMISGESIPVSKDVGDFVYGSTINQMGTIYIRVTKTSSENTLSSIDKLIHESQNAKVPIQRIADNVSAVFVPVIIGIAFLAFVIWISLCYAGVLETNLHPITFALQFSLAILVISCPCAISLAAPTAVMVGIAKGIEFGVLFKNGAVIEMCHKVNTVVFDKTGTLTNGKPVVTDVLLFEGDDLQHFKSIIGSAELGSEHVIGKAISTHVEKEGLPTEQPIDYQAVPGKGLKCSVFGKEVIAGNCTWMKDNSIAISEMQQEQIFNLENQGKTIVHVAVDGHLHGIVALSDTLKTESKLVVDELKKMNVEIWVVSGDNQVTTQYIANQLGIENVMANVLPANKREKVRELQAGKTSKGKSRVVSMIGDGINDSPSLAQADVGFAIGCGSDIALETADIILVKSDLRDVLVALDLSRTTFRRIKINFLWAFLYNAIGIPLSAGVFYPILGIAIPPAIAGLSEIFSSIPVILFSLLLKMYKPKVY